MAMYNNNGSQAPDYRNPYKQRQMQQQQNQQWLEKMKADRASGTGAYQIQPGGPNVATDPYQMQQAPTFSSQAPMMYPNQNQISTVGNPNGPRPRPRDPNSAGPRQNYAPGQQAYNGPAISPMQRPPQSAFGQQNQTRFIPGFQPNASQGFGRGTINPYQTQQRQFRNTVW